MLKSLGINWALAGHSERRTINKESDEDINRQCLKLIQSDMNVVLCIGETLEEFEKELVGAVCEIQLKKNLAGVSSEDMKKVTIAYEVRSLCTRSRPGTSNDFPNIVSSRSLFGRLELERLLRLKSHRVCTKHVDLSSKACTARLSPQRSAFSTGVASLQNL